ncbi:MAG: ABC transporter permease [Myxococcales bacterium]|nr:ABC transporter permease [Myxococcales bacterium]
MIPVSYNLRNLAVRKSTTAAAALGLALVVFVLSASMMLNRGIQKTLGRSASPDVAIVLRKGSDAELSSGIEDASASIVTASKEIKKTAEGLPLFVNEVVAVILLEKLGTDGGLSNAQVRGVPDGVLRFRPTVKIVDGRAAQPGSDEVIIGKAIRGRFRGLDIGQTFELKKNRPVKVVGVFSDEGSSHESEVWCDLHLVRTAFGREGSVSSLRVRLESASAFDTFKASIESNRQLGLVVTRETDFLEKQSEGTRNFITALAVMITLFISIGAMIGATITMHASVAHRQREIGTLRALGFSRGTILASFLLESTFLALLGGIAGATASLGMAFVRPSLMNFSSWSEIVFSFEPTPKILGTAIFVGGLMGIIGGFMPAIRAARVSPIEAMRN